LARFPPAVRRARTARYGSAARDRITAKSAPSRKLAKAVVVKLEHLCYNNIGIAIPFIIRKYGETMIVCDALARVIEKETFAEILACLSAEELLVAALRMEGLSDPQIASLLGMSRQAVRQRLRKAQMRIMRTKPDLAPPLLGRCLSNAEALPTATPTLPLEHGWLCDPWP
jgi:hypothetical protein